ncbi:MAG TPA: leucyl/phenylalanyl-tRNA--protein transferase [Candidatus Hydrogenedentes bacterium]|nr:leucyl/phenylalanyl-tRNA--protein transferase [Candidatus Hydrogenedentota bacterium]
MPVYRLTKHMLFPPPHHAEDGLLAVGGDLHPKRLLLAYGHGIFPWYSEGEPIMWWSPDPRTILIPEEFHVSRSLKRVIKGGEFRVTLDTAFAAVISGCATAPRKREKGTWIVPEMEQAYIRLHALGFAHSAECWRGEELAGGLYGVSLGACFFGESMFSRCANASKVALAFLVEQFKRWDISLIDCQLTTPHLIGLGAREVSRDEYLNMLRQRLHAPTRQGAWRLECDGGNSE